MKTVHRQRLEVAPEVHVIMMHSDAGVVAVENVDATVLSGPEMLDVWYEVDESSTRPKMERTFVIRGTGWSVDDNAEYVGTGGRTRAGYVWHLWEVT